MTVEQFLLVVALLSVATAGFAMNAHINVKERNIGALFDILIALIGYIFGVAAFLAAAAVVLDALLNTYRW